MTFTTTCQAWSSDEFHQIIQWAYQAGQIALRYFGNVEPQEKSDHTLLTLADLEIEHFLVEQICSAYPDDGLISEEGTRIENKFSTNIWVIDPLDGTTAFALGLPGWGISIGLLQQGQPCFGLFYMPLLDDLTYTAGPNQICDHNGCNRQYAVRHKWGSKSFLAVNSSAHYDYHIAVRHMRNMGSVGANLIYTARGIAAAAFLPKAHVWDLVAGEAILRQGGGELRYLSGNKVDYGQLFGGVLAPEPIVAGHPDILADLPRSILSKGMGQ
jgi:myo-inositol-1(or 4)-monophosphatase